jgi:hypothetical protein
MMKMVTSTLATLTLARAGQRGVAGVAAGCWVVGGAAQYGRYPPPQT